MTKKRAKTVKLIAAFCLPILFGGALVIPYDYNYIEIDCVNIISNNHTSYIFVAARRMRHRSHIARDLFYWLQNAMDVESRAISYHQYLITIDSNRVSCNESELVSPSGPLPLCEGVAFLVNNASRDVAVWSRDQWIMLNSSLAHETRKMVIPTDLYIGRIGWVSVYDGPPGRSSTWKYNADLRADGQSLSVLLVNDRPSWKMGDTMKINIKKNGDIVFDKIVDIRG